jgi:hypothetical protein
VYQYIHTGRRFRRGEYQHNGTKNDSSRWKGKGGKKSKERRKLSRAHKQQQYAREQTALQVLRQSERVRKHEAEHRQAQVDVREDSVCEQLHMEVREDSPEATDPTQFLLPPPQIAPETHERTTVLNTHRDETVVPTTIFEQLRKEIVTDNDIVSNVLEEVFDNDEAIYETTNHVEVVELTEEEQIEIQQLHTAYNHRYYRANPDFNKQKFRELGIENVVMKNSYYNFTNDNPYLSRIYENERKLIDLVQQENDDRIAATNQYNQNQIEARRKERTQTNPLIELTRLTDEQKEENKRFRNDHKERMIQNKRQKRQKRLEE